MSLIIREIRDAAGLLELEQPWDELLRASAVDGVFLTWEHARTWWEFYGEGKMGLRVLVAEDEDGRLVGIAPLVIGPGEPGVRASFRHLAIIGGLGDSLSEYLDLIIERGREIEVARLFEEYVNTSWRGKS